MEQKLRSTPQKSSAQALNFSEQLFCRCSGINDSSSALQCSDMVRIAKSISSSPFREALDLSGRPFQLAAAEDMKMQMIHGLACRQKFSTGMNSRAAIRLIDWKQRSFRE